MDLQLAGQSARGNACISRLSSCIEQLVVEYVVSTLDEREGLEPRNQVDVREPVCTDTTSTSTKLTTMCRDTVGRATLVEAEKDGIETRKGSLG